MKASQAVLTALFVIIVAVFVRRSDQSELLLGSKDICRLFKDGDVLRKPGTCGETIKCENFKSNDHSLKCPGFYNVATQKCVTSLPKTDSYCASPCKTKSPKYVKDKTNCRNWIQCVDGKEKKREACPNNLYFDEGKQLCTYSSQTSCEATFEFCDVAPANVPFDDENNCHKYYICSSKGDLESKTCDLGMYYDAKYGACIPKAQVDCYKHPTPKDACGTTKLAIRSRFIDDRATCRGYFYCKDEGSRKPDLNPTWGQCPVGSFFDEEEQSCLHPSQVKCDEDRCDGYGNEIALSSRPGCRHYLLCENNITVAEFQCPEGKYFHADTKECSYTYVPYPACT